MATEREIRTLLRYVPRRAHLFTWSLLGAIIRGGALLTIPYLLARVVDGAAESSVPIDLIVITVALQVVSAAGMLFVRARVLEVTKGSILDLRRRMIRAIDGWALAEVSRQDHEDLSEFYEAGVTRLDIALRQLLLAAIPSGITALGSLLFLAWVTPGLVPVASIAGLVAGGIIWNAHRKVRSLLGDVLDGVRRVRGGFARWVTNALLLRSRGIDDAEARRQMELAADFRDVTAKAVLATARLNEISTIGTLAVLITVLIVGGLQVESGAISAGDLAGALAALALMRGPVQQLVTTWPAFVEGALSAQRVEQVLAVESRRPYDGSRRIDRPNHIRAIGLRFRYGDNIVLDGTDIEIRTGELVVLRGANGIGKSTLGRLLLGFQAPEQGRIDIDGEPMSEIDLRHFRRGVGYLPQDPQLIAGTVRDNLTLGRDSASQHDLEQSYRLAGLEVLLGPLDTGMATMIDEDARNISGGQRQAIALAGALVGEPSIIILDEPTAHIADALATQIISGLPNLPGKPGVLLITHHDVPAGIADRVVELRDGRVIGEPA